MLKKTLISFFIFISLALVSLSIIFVYSEQSRNFIISKLNITHFINKKLENYLSNKINNDDIVIQIENIEFLKPKLPNIIHLRLNNIDINSSVTFPYSTYKNDAKISLIFSIFFKFFD